MKTGKRKIRDGSKYNRFFAKPTGENRTVKKEATLRDTLYWMKRVIADTLDQTKKIARHLQGESAKQTCKRIWNFCFSHFQYTKDEMRKEQIRTPNRAWWDRKQGIDCDCFTVLIGSILTHLGIPYVMRMTRYEALDFEHIYPVALTEEGEIIIDAVVHQFNYEVPYTEKEDVEMELEVLSGVKGERYNEFGDKVHFENELPIDAEDLFVDTEAMELEGLEGRAERIARRKRRKAKRAAKKAKRKAKRSRKKTVRKAERARAKAERKKRNAEIKKLPLKQRIKARVKQGLHVINKLNPGIALLRAGVLAGMKLNIFKIASRLRFAYWTAEEARKNGMDMAKFNQLQRIREKLEKIYFGAGGKPRSLKKAILTGRGNRNKQVRFNGLGEVIDAVSDEDDLKNILGEELYMEEFEALENLDGFGEPATIATGASITAATGILGTIAGFLKKIGAFFKKGTKMAEKFKIQDNADNQIEKNRKFSVKNLFSKIKQKIQQKREQKAQSGGRRSPSTQTGENDGLTPMEPVPEDEFVLDPSEFETGSRAQVDDGSVTTDSENGDDKEKSWFKKNMAWLIPVGAVTLLGGTALAIHLVKKGKKKSGRSVNGISSAIDGVSKKKKKQKKTKSRKKTTSRKKRVTRRKTSSKSKSSGIKKYELM